MLIANVCRKVPRQNRKVPAKSLILLTAKSLRGALPQSPAKSRKAQCFQARKAPQSYDRKVPPYGGRLGVPPMGLSLSPSGFGGAGMAEIADQQTRSALRDDIPYWRLLVRGG
jgi:hypothetical protein